MRLLEHFLEPDPLHRPQNVSEALLITKETLFQYGNLVLKKSSGAEKDEFLDSIKSLESGFRTSFLPFTFSRYRRRQDPLHSMRTWSSIIAEKKLLPQPFKEHFIEYEKEFPYTVYIPQQLVMGMNLQNPILLCLYQKKLVTYENRKKS
jgi:hypothetical protein